VSFFVKTRKSLPLVALLLALPAATACKSGNPESFNEEAAQLVCEFNDECSEVVGSTLGEEQWMRFEYAQGAGGSVCEEDFLQKHESCGGECKFDRRQARRCLSKLRKAVRKCELKTRWMESCQDVYDCTSTGDNLLVDECGIEYSNGLCSCDASRKNGSPVGALGLVCLGIGLMRRRHSSLA
jgi:hypothetical protein